MTFHVVIQVIDEDDASSDPLRAAWSVNHFHSEKEAIEEAEDICSQHYARTGVEPSQLVPVPCDDCGRTDGTHNLEMEH